MAGLVRMVWVGWLGYAMMGLALLARKAVEWRGRLCDRSLPRPFYLVTLRAPNLSALITVDGGGSAEQAREHAITVLRFVAANGLAHADCTTERMTSSSAIRGKMVYAARLGLAALFGFALALTL